LVKFHERNHLETLTRLTSWEIATKGKESRFQKTGRGQFERTSAGLQIIEDSERVIKVQASRLLSPAPDQC